MLLRGIAEALARGLQSAGDSFEGLFAHESLLVFLLNADDFLLNANQTDGAKGADGCG